MAAGQAAAATAMHGGVAPAVLLLLLLAGGAHADCYGDCFNDCMARLKERDYCSYACDKVCSPDADDATRRRLRPLAAVAPAASSLADHRPSDRKQDADADAVRPAALPDHPFHGTHGGGGGEPDPGHAVLAARVAVLP